MSIDAGVVLGGNAQVTFSGNRFLDNEIGVMLLLPPCRSRPFFVGEVQGADNVFEGNAQDLCPADFPWPEGFIAPPENE